MSRAGRHARSRARDRALVLLAALACVVGMLCASARAVAAPLVDVSQAKFRIDLGEGRILEGAGLVGVILHLRDRTGEPLEVRIDSVTSPLDRPDSGVELYGLSRHGSDGAWAPLCKPGADGRALGFPLPASARSDEDGGLGGDGFSIACTAGARGKCVMLGYRPWARAPNGESLQPYFEACVRMMRADYCGDGRSHTRPGIQIDMWDRAGVQVAQSDMPFEAAWGPDGAVCLAKVRVSALSSLDEILAGCPRLAAVPPSSCESGSKAPGGGALMWNGSPAR